MHHDTDLNASDAPCVRTRCRTPGHTVIRVQAGGGPSPDAPVDFLRHIARQDAVTDLLVGAIRSVDTVSELADGSFACLLAGAPGKERLSLLAWKLLDALARLPAAHGVAPALAGGTTGPRRPCIGICVGPAQGLSYFALAGRARTALVRARSQQSGFAFFDGDANPAPRPGPHWRR
jgi:hypothetical protein